MKKIQMNTRLKEDQVTVSNIAFAGSQITQIK